MAPVPPFPVILRHAQRDVGPGEAGAMIVVLEAIERVNRELGTTAAVITHNAVIAAMADRVVTLSAGRIAEVRRNLRRVAARELVW